MTGEADKTPGMLRWLQRWGRQIDTQTLNRSGRGPSQRLSHDTIVAAIAALATGVALTISQSLMDDRRQHGAELAENLRFVRERSSSEVAQARPFSDINLEDQTLNGLRLNEADFSGASLSGASLAKMRLSRANMEGADLSFARIRDSRLVGANLSKANLTGLNFGLTDLSGARLDGAKADIWMASTSSPGIVASSLVGASMRDVELGRWLILASDLRDVDMQGADLFWAEFSYVNLSGANLSDSNFGTASVEHICYDAMTRWPDGYVPPRSEPIACGVPSSMDAVSDFPWQLRTFRNRSLPTE